MKSKTFITSVGATVLAVNFFAAVFVLHASATDTPSPSPAATAEASASDEAEIQTLLTAQPEIAANTQSKDDAADSATSEDAKEQAAFDDDIKTALQVGDSASAAQLTAAATALTTIDAPEIQAVAADDAEAQTLILGLTQK